MELFPPPLLLVLNYETPHGFTDSLVYYPNELEEAKNDARWFRDHGAPSQLICIPTLGMLIEFGMKWIAKASTYRDCYDVGESQRRQSIISHTINRELKNYV